MHRKKDNLKLILVLFSIQVVIIILFLMVLTQSYPISEKNIISCNITVDDISFYSRGSKIENYFSIWENSTEYRIIPIKGYTINELYEKIRIGDNVSICYYVNSFNLQGKKNIVVECTNETQLLYAFDDFISERKIVFTIVIIIFAFIELIYIFVVAITYKISKV